MTIRAREAVVAEFLRKALAIGPLNVPELEMMARAAGLLGECQRITQTKLFRRVKDALGIRSLRNGFGKGGGWSWEWPPGSDAPLTISARHEPSAPREPVVPREWVQGVARLEQDSTVHQIGTSPGIPASKGRSGYSVRSERVWERRRMGLGIAA